MYTNMILQANFVTNPFLAAAGSYNGLFYPAGGMTTEASSGFISVNVSGNGAFSGKVLLDGLSNSLSGYSFDLTGSSVITNLARSGKTPLNLTLKLDLYPADGKLGGTVNTNAASGWQSTISADLALFSVNTNLATNYAGKWTVLLPPDATAPAGSPAGYGYLLISNSLGGMSTILGGALADGNSLMGSAPISATGYMPLYQSLYSSKGSLLGWIHFTNEPPQNVAADSWFSWIKPPVAGTLYPQGFASLVTSGVLGSPFANTAGGPVLNLTNATLVLGGGNLTNGALTFTNLNLSANSVTNAAQATGHGETNYLVITVNTNYGNVTVIFQPTGSKTNTARGAVLQNSTNALGAFPGTNQTGSFILH
jgi:hypothetical protein